jgi:selenocysteine-specific elongation factor
MVISHLAVTGGLALSDLRGAFEKLSGLDAAFDDLTATLVRDGFVVKGAVIQRAAHQPSLPPALQGSGQRIRETLSRRPLDPPNRSELAPDALSQQVLRHLLQTGEAVELGPDALLNAEAYALAKERIREFLKARGRATASDLRQMLGTSRRILIPLLERLDREGVTRREGDSRVLRTPP